MRRVFSYALTAILSAMAGAAALWWFSLRPTLAFWDTDRVRADREAARAAAIDKELADSRKTLDGIGIALEAARGTIGRLTIQHEADRRTLAQIEARNRELESVFSNLGGGIVELGDAVIGDADLARRATEAVRGALAIAISLQTGDARPGP